MAIYETCLRDIFHNCINRSFVFLCNKHHYELYSWSTERWKFINHFCYFCFHHEVDNVVPGNWNFHFSLPLGGFLFLRILCQIIKVFKIECLTQTYQQIKDTMKPNGKPQSFYLARALIITMDLLIFILGKSHSTLYQIIFFNPSKISQQP